MKGLIGIAVLGVSAAALLSVAGLWLLIAVTRAIAVAFGFPLWGVYGAIGIALGIIGLVLVAVLSYEVRAMHVLPRTRESLRAQRLIPFWHATERR